MLEKVKEIIEKVEYMNIASITPEGKPWNSPVYISYDGNLNFYWFSWEANQHSKNIKNNPDIFCTIYDSTVPAGTGFGAYFAGKGSELSNPLEIMVGLKTHYSRTKSKMKAVEMFLTKFPRRVFRFTPEKLWLNGNDMIEGNYIDTRTELNLEELKKLLK